MIMKYGLLILLLNSYIQQQENPLPKFSKTMSLTETQTEAPKYSNGRLIAIGDFVVAKKDGKDRIYANVLCISTKPKPKIAVRFSNGNNREWIDCRNKTKVYTPAELEYVNKAAWI
jgi:hypothetical protein